MLSKLHCKLVSSQSLCGQHIRWRLLCAASQPNVVSRPDNSTPVKEPEPVKQSPVFIGIAPDEPAGPLGNCVVGLFSGKINPNLLVYPELDTVDEVEAVHKLAEPVEKFFADQIHSSQLDTSAQLTQEQLSGLRSLGLFGQAAPASFGGLELSAVAQARLAEATSADASVELTLRANNCLGLRALLAAGSPQQLQQFAGPLARGEKLAALCLAEPGGGGGFSDPKSSVRATAVLGEDGEHWRLNGCKVWITNGPTADLFVVFALTTVHSGGGYGKSESTERITAFLVERGLSGVDVGPPEPKLGARAAVTGALHLTDVRVPVENVLGKVGDGVRLARQVAAWSRLSSGASVVGSLKRLMAGMAVRCSARRMGGAQPLSDYPLVKKRLARLAGQIYATESVVYQTAFLFDRFPDADLTSEAAVIALLSSRAALNGAIEAATIAGGGPASAAGGEFPYERLLRDAWTLACADSPADLVRLQLASRGVKVAAREASKAALKVFAARGFFDRLRLMKAQSNISVITGDARDILAVHFHHNLAGVANSIEVNTLAFSNAVRYCMHYYKEDLFKEQLLLNRMAECAVDLFTLISCTSRASRSKSIGLRSADHELDLVVMLSKEATLRLEHNISGFDMNTVFIRHPDAEFRRITDYACKFGGYSVDHAIARNWN